MRAWVRAHWWRPPLTGRLLAGRLFGYHPSDAGPIVGWLAVGAFAISMAIGGYAGAGLGGQLGWWAGVLTSFGVLALVLPVVWVIMCAVWVEGTSHAPSELVRARRRLQHAAQWARVEGWLDHQLSDAENNDPSFDLFPRDHVDERFDSPGRAGEVGSYAAFLVQIFLASGRLEEARAELDDIRRSLPRASARARARLRHLSGLVARAEEDLAAANRAHRDALTGQLDGHHWPDLAASIESLAGLALARGDAAVCARLAGAAEALRARVGVSTRLPFEEQCLHRDLTIARVVLGDEFDTRFAEGTGLDAHEAVVLALAS